MQVVSLLLRSSGRTGEAAVREEDEMDYSLKLNKELPDDIRVLAWCTVPADFSARHASQLCSHCAMRLHKHDAVACSAVWCVAEADA